MKIADVTRLIEEFAPTALQESWDNAGMQVGNPQAETTGVLLCLDVTEAIIDESIAKGINLIITHHPLLFRGMKSITGRNAIERIVIKAIKNDIAIYSAHTNMDSAWGGVSHLIAKKLGLADVEVLSRQQGKMFKLVVFVPNASLEKVRDAVTNAGAGRIGDYDCCSYQLQGEGTFRALPGADPYVGQVGELHREPEMRLEVVLPSYCKNRVLRAMLDAHPYEEPAYDLIALENESKYSGLGVVGNLPESEDAVQFLSRVKAIFGTGAVRYSGDVSKRVKRIAVCGGAGAEFVHDAVACEADMLITGDVKYHEFMTDSDKIIIADIGHYESEHFTKEIFNEIITKKIPNFAIHYAELEKNPINYL